ncbi:MAG TPA: hypothetical protein PKU83_10220, partial [Chryseolinea sp.]|nr:hypothetical protein [Chryseolinea sp.]
TFAHDKLIKNFGRKILIFIVILFRGYLFNCLVIPIQYSSWLSKSEGLIKLSLFCIVPLQQEAKRPDYMAKQATGSF